MKEQILILGLPLRTFIIVGGFFALSAILPTIIALVLQHRRVKDNE